MTLCPVSTVLLGLLLLLSLLRLHHLDVLAPGGGFGGGLLLGVDGRLLGDILVLGDVIEGDHKDLGGVKIKSTSFLNRFRLSKHVFEHETNLQFAPPACPSRSVPLDRLQVEEGPHQHP